jgi:outer membrane protein TolC
VRRLAGLTVLLLGAAGAQAAPLQLGEVLDATLAHHPALRAAASGQQVAEADRQAAAGAFDLKLGATGKAVPVGKQTWLYTDVGLRQPTTVWGAEVFGGWRRSGGDVPLYAGDKITTGAGEVVLGVTVPLWQGGAIDAARAKITQADQKARLAELDVASTRLKLSGAAAEAYWGWVAAGHRLRIVQHLCQMAEARDAQIVARVRGGDLAPIEHIENQRAILKRRSQRIKAEQRLAKAALKLSIYARDAEGRPRAPTAAALPRPIPPPEPDPSQTLAADQAAARAQQPALQKLARYRAVLAVNQALAQNQGGPRIDLTVAGVQPVAAASDDPYRKSELEAGLKFALPLQRRKARGAEARAVAQIAQLDHQRTAIEQQLDAAVAQVRVALVAATARVAVAEAEVQVAEQVEAAEKTRLSLGDSTLLIVNLREQASADAANRRIEALADHHVAWAQYLATTAKGLDRAAWTPWVPNGAPQ